MATNKQKVLLNKNNNNKKKKKKNNNNNNNNNIEYNELLQKENEQLKLEIILVNNKLQQLNEKMEEVVSINNYLRNRISEIDIELEDIYILVGLVNNVLGNNYLNFK